MSLQKPGGQGQQYKILLVDDEENILSSLRRLLRKENLDVHDTTSPEEALRLLSLNEYAVLVSDHRMPGMTGTQLMKMACKTSPETVRIILTGYADAQSSIEAINKGAVSRYLLKPWNEIELRVAVRQAVAQYRLVQEKKELENITNDLNKELQSLAVELETKVEERTREVSTLNRQLESSLLASIRMLAELTEMNCEVVGKHAKRVAAFSREIGRRLGMSNPELLQLEAAAMLHGIGTVGLSASLLAKPRSALATQEKELLDSDSLRGEAVISMMPNLAPAALYVRHMHELFNGQGYPEHLKGDRIPLGSRIITAVDVYDTQLNLRENDKAVEPLNALQHLKDRSPAFYDPQVVSMMEECLTEDQWQSLGADEIEVRLNDLRSGMVLSRDVITTGGTLLLSRDVELKVEDIARIKAFMDNNPFLSSIFIHRKK
ncbi:response regulator [bacterium]|nr:response regulator [bacterium]